MVFENFLWLLSNIAIIIYFSLKDIVIGKFSKKRVNKKYSFGVVIVSFVALLVNNQINLNYEKFLDLTPIKGSIPLPPLTLIFIASDFIGTILVELITHLRSRSIKIKILVDLLQLFLIYVIFSTMISHFWQKSFLNMHKTGWGFSCFKSQITIDLANFYFTNSKFPRSLEEFTSLRVNPLNNSKIKYIISNWSNFRVTDNEGNVLVENGKDLVGLTIYKDNPNDFFNSFRNLNNTMCNGSLVIPTF